MKSRIKQIRKSNDLNQTEFGAKIGVKQSTVASYEAGSVPPDTVVKAICREFEIREEWLRTGDGSMKEEKPRNKVLTEKLNGILTAGDDDFRKRLIAILVELPSDKWSILEEMAESVVNGKPKPNAPAPAAPKNVHEWTREEMDAEYKRQMDAEQREREEGTGEPSAGSPNVSGADCA